MERALQMIELLRVGVATAPFPDDAYLEVLLQVADSSTTYRSRYLTAIRTRYVLELLLADESQSALGRLPGRGAPRRRRRRCRAGRPSHAGGGVHARPSACGSCSATSTWTTSSGATPTGSGWRSRRTSRRSATASAICPRRSRRAI